MIKIYIYISSTIFFFLNIYTQSFADKVINKLDEYIIVNMRSVNLTIMRGYLPHIYRKESEFYFSDIKSIAFDFWMPSRNYVNSDEAIRGFTIDNNNEPDNIYIVKVMQFTPTEYDDIMYYDAARRLNNLLTNLHSKFNDYGFGLLQIQNGLGIKVNDLNFTFKNSKKYEVLITCTPDSIKVPSPACQMMGQSREHDISFMILFPKDRLIESEEIVESIFNIVTIN